MLWLPGMDGNHEKRDSPWIMKAFYTMKGYERANDDVFHGRLPGMVCRVREAEETGAGACKPLAAVNLRVCASLPPHPRCWIT